MEMAGFGPDKNIPPGHPRWIKRPQQTPFVETQKGLSVALSQTAHYDGSGIQDYVEC